MKLALKLAAALAAAMVVFGVGWLVAVAGVGRAADPASLSDRETAFTERMRNVVLVGHFTLEGRERRDGLPERYEISSVTKLDGERIEEAEVEIGYLHRGFEKMAEQVDYNGVIPYTDRLNYVSSAINNVGYCMAVVKLIGIAVPERCQ